MEECWTKNILKKLIKRGIKDLGIKEIMMKKSPSKSEKEMIHLHIKAKGGSAKKKKKFPDMSGDGKVTMKDVLMARGVIPKKKKTKKKVI